MIEEAIARLQAAFDDLITQIHGQTTTTTAPVVTLEPAPAAPEVAVEVPAVGAPPVETGSTAPTQEELQQAAAEAANPGGPNAPAVAPAPVEPAPVEAAPVEAAPEPATPPPAGV